MLECAACPRTRRRPLAHGRRAEREASERPSIRGVPRGCRDSSMRAARALSLLWILAATSACPQPARAQTADPPAPQGSMTDRFDAAWAAYVATTDPASLQPDCQAARFDPDPAQPYRGTVVMIHGFAACPQQYFDLAPELQARGWRVLLPLLPGHGRSYSDPDADEFSRFATSQDWQPRWDALAAHVNGMLALVAGEKVIVGHSLGAATSLYLNLQAPALYDRHLLVTPFLDPPLAWLTRPVIVAAEHIPGLREIELTSPAGTPCRERRAAGFAGTCHYQVKHLGALKHLADTVWDWLQQPTLEVRVQVIWTQGDGVVGQGRTRELLDWHQPGAPVAMCHFGKDVPHQILSRYEHPGQPMPWLESFTALAAGFILDGATRPARPSGDLVPCI
jgi:pimeloyl-ACP methyl ester carboxylesterase